MGDAIQLIGYGGYDQMKIVHLGYPELEPDNCIVEIKACGTNFCDILNRMGIFTYNNVQPPFILGSEGSGVVKEIGPNVENLKVGDRVMCWSFSYGLFAQYISIPARQCYIIPEGIEFEEAAAIPINYLTAYFSVLKFGNIKPGESILIQCAAGGVGWAATQLAHTVPNVTVFGTSSAEKHQHIKDNGVTHAINYRTSDFVKEILKISPEGIDVVVDCLSGHDFIRAENLLKDMGRIIHLGISSAINGEYKSWWKLLRVWWQAKNIRIVDLITKNHSVCGLNTANLHERNPELFRNALSEILKFYTEGKIKPKIDSVWTFKEVEKAQQRMLDRKNIGKIILIPNEI